MEPTKPTPLSALIPWAAAVALAAAAAWLGALYFVTRAEVRLLRQELALAELSARSARNEVEAERILHRREMAAAEAGAAEPKGSPKSR